MPGVFGCGWDAGHLHQKLWEVWDWLAHHDLRLKPAPSCARHLQVSLPAGWEWDGGWALDRGGGVDKEGWAYAADFGQLKFPPPPGEWGWVMELGFFVWVGIGGGILHCWAGHGLHCSIKRFTFTIHAFAAGACP